MTSTRSVLNANLIAMRDQIADRHLVTAAHEIITGVIDFDDGQRLVLESGLGFDGLCDITRCELARPGQQLGRIKIKHLSAKYPTLDPMTQVELPSGVVQVTGYDRDDQLLLRLNLGWMSPRHDNDVVLVSQIEDLV